MPTLVQPSDRARLGLLEKHKDYILRARWVVVLFPIPTGTWSPLLTTGYASRLIKACACGHEPEHVAGMK